MSHEYIDVQVEPGKPGAGVSKNLPRECAQGDQPARCPNHFFAFAPLLLFHGGDMTCFDVVKLLAGRDEVMWLVVR